MKWPFSSRQVLESIESSFENNSWWRYKGDRIRAFEDNFSTYHSAKFGISVCNGTVPLEIILRALDIGEGDEVILPAYNYFTSPKGVRNTGAEPVFADVTSDNFTIDPTGIEKAITKRTRAVLAVHISSSVAKMDEITDICSRKGIHLIEDCAQATGAEYDGKKAGTFGIAGFYSFGGVKLMTCGQGGMIVTDDRTLYEKAYAMANRGWTIDGRVNSHGIIGDNYQLSELSAYILQPQLDGLDALLEERESIMEVLDEEITKISGFRTIGQPKQVRFRAQMAYGFICDFPGLRAKNVDEIVQLAHRENLRIMRGHSAVKNDEQLFETFAQNREFENADFVQNSILRIMHYDLFQTDAYYDSLFSFLEDLCI